ncbi:hypothetical protein GGR21_001377 [Dysgonomonas hofstadii]|uniref:Uncharacterized protein n=1 Tax=Dysgonomonas hofstadii TaxID=637886 RepID=A0A840CPJ4_9BACT|nr:hypothetical protein [Dysgonomonas hofstadii]
MVVNKIYHNPLYEENYNHFLYYINHHMLSTLVLSQKTNVYTIIKH